MAGDPFTSAIFGWFNRVAADPTLPPAAFKLAYIISQHINRKTLTAWPAQSTLAEAMGIKSDRTIRRLVDALVAGGHLLTTQRRQSSLVYRLARDRTELSGLDAEMETNEEFGAGSEELRPDKNVRPQVTRPDIPDRKTGQKCPVRPDKNVRLTTESNHLKNHEGESARATLLPEDFRLDDETHNWALDKLGSNDAVARSVSRFVNHHRQVTGRRAKSRDWPAKLRNWIDDDAAKRVHEKLVSFNALAAPADDEWDSALSTFAKFGHWTRHVDRFGPSPISPDCRAPQHLLIKHGLKDAAA